MIDVIWAVMNITTALIFMVVINWKMALMVFAIIPILVLVALWFKQKIIGEYRTVRKINSKITGSYNENITGIRVFKSLRREEENLREFAQLTSHIHHASYTPPSFSPLFLSAAH